MLAGGGEVGADGQEGLGATAASLDLSATVCVVAGFWHILWIAGVGMLAGGIVGLAVHSAGYVRLEQDQEPTPQEGEQPGGTGS